MILKNNHTSLFSGHDHEKLENTVYTAGMLKSCMFNIFAEAHLHF